MTGHARAGHGSDERSASRICVSVAAADLLDEPGTRAGVPGTEAGVSESRGSGPATLRADLLEVRLDLHRDPGSLDSARLGALVEASPLPVIFTCRPAWEGGGFAGTEAERRVLLERAALAGPAFVDVEQDAEWSADFIAESPAPAIWSHHWDRPRPRDVEQRVERFAGRGAAVVKLVAPAESPDEALPLLRAGARMVGEGQPATAFCTGEAGRASRLLVATYGGAFTYAAPPGRSGVAEGQWAAERLVDELGWERWRRGHRCCGLIGDPLELSLSPRLFNAAFAAAGAPLVYLPIPWHDLDGALALAGGWEFRGLSVTMPFKRGAAERCVRLDEEAEAMGAVNTLVWTPVGWEGHNTDGVAVVEALGGAAELAGRRVAILGAGGAARGAAVALRRVGAEVAVLNRTVSRAEELAARVEGRAGSLDELAGLDADVVINATPVGMAGEAPGRTPVPAESLGGDEIVLDMVYRPSRTPLLRAAAERGCRTVGGAEMFVRQAAVQYRLWVGEEADLEAMRRTIEEALDGDDR